MPYASLTMAATSASALAMSSARTQSSGVSSGCRPFTCARGMRASAHLFWTGLPSSRHLAWQGFRVFEA